MCLEWERQVIGMTDGLFADVHACCIWLEEFTGAAECRGGVGFFARIQRGLLYDMTSQCRPALFAFGLY